MCLVEISREIAAGLYTNIFDMVLVQLNIVRSAIAPVSQRFVSSQVAGGERCQPVELGTQWPILAYGEAYFNTIITKKVTLPTQIQGS